MNFGTAETVNQYDYHVDDCNALEAAVAAKFDIIVSSSSSSRALMDKILKADDDAADTIIECSASGLDGSSLIT
jgi:hypothetical protein